MKDCFVKSKNITFMDPCVKITSVLNKESEAKLKELAKIISEKM